MSRAVAQAEYDRAAAAMAAVEARIDAVDVFPDRAAELRADAAYTKAESALADAVAALHAAGGQTREEIAASAPPSVRFAVVPGEDIGLGPSWAVVVAATGEHVYALGSEAKARAYIAQADARWERKRAIAARRAAAR